MRNKIGLGRLLVGTILVASSITAAAPAAATASSVASSANMSNPIARLRGAGRVASDAISLNGTKPSGLICSSVAIRSAANNKYVSAEVGYSGSLYGMLRARGPLIGGLEAFELCWMGDWPLDTKYSSYATCILPRTGTT
jgi:hypothetical protein